MTRSRSPRGHGSASRVVGITAIRQSAMLEQAGGQFRPALMSLHGPGIRLFWSGTIVRSHTRSRRSIACWAAERVCSRGRTAVPRGAARAYPQTLASSCRVVLRPAAVYARSSTTCSISHRSPASDPPARPGCHTRSYAAGRRSPPLTRASLPPLTGAAPSADGSTQRAADFNRLRPQFPVFGSVGMGRPRPPRTARRRAA